MSSSKMNFKGPQGLANIDKIIALLNERGQVDTNEIAMRIGLSDNHTARYLSFMSGECEGDEPMVWCVRRAKAIQSGKLPAIWTTNPAYAAALESTDDMPRRVIVSNAWQGVIPAMFEPMAYLYGRAA